MSESIEQRVVQMKFDTSQFAAKVQDTMSLLDRLKSSLKLDGASKGLQDVNASADKFSLNHASNEVSSFAGKFTALQVTAVTALSNIVNKAVDTGLQLAKSLTIEPLQAGFREYETNLNSIQTILANTGLKGAEGLTTVTDALDTLNEYSDKTIFNFSEMSKNIGTFTAAGVKLDVATSAIKGIANLAAISGSNAEQASAAMYQLSQALASGKVTLEDWNSVVNAGMGGKVFQDALVETARVHGVNVDEIIKKQGSFRLSLEKGWLTSGILTETLSKFTGELSLEQIKSMGYTDEQAQGILEMGQTAVDAATKVKTMTQLLSTLRESVGSGWAKTWQIVFGDFDEAKTLFTSVNNVLGKAIGDASDARNQLLRDWKDLGGRQALIDGIGNSFKALLSVLKPIGDALRAAFPAATAQQLFEMTTRFRDFAAGLKIGEETANNLRRTFAGLFAVLGIGWDLLKAGVNFFFDLFGKVTQGSGGILRFTGNIGDFLVALRKALQDGQAFTRIFDVLARVIGIPLKLLQDFGQLIAKVFKKLDMSPVEESFENLGNKLKPVLTIGDQIHITWERVVNILSNGLKAFTNIASTVWNAIKKVGSAISDLLGGVSFDDVLKGFNTGLLAGLIVMIGNFLRNLSFFGGNGGFIEGLKDALAGLTGALQGMQNALNAAALLAIAIAIGVLTLSVKELAKISPEGMAKAGVAIAVMMGQLAAGFVLFDKVSTTASAAKLVLTASALIRLGIAIRTLVASVEILAKLSWNELAKGLLGVTVLLAGLIVAVNLLPKRLGGMLSTALALFVLGAAIHVLVGAVTDLGAMNWETMAKGLVGVGTLLASLILFTKFVQADKLGLSSGLGLILLATSLKILASALEDFVKYNWEQLARGMAGIAVGLAAIVLALRLLPENTAFKAAGVLIVAASLSLIADAVGKMANMSWMEIARGMTVMAGALAAIALSIAFLPPHSLMSAAAILVVAVSLGLIQDALGKMGGMTWEEIAKGLIVLAGSLLLIAAACWAMQTALPGAAAILVVAIALNIMVPVLQALGAMSWEAIVKGLVTLAAVFVILGLAGYILGPLAPAIVALAGSIALLGAAVFLAGVGVLAFGLGLTLLAASGAAASVALIALIAGLVGLIPFVMEQIALGMIAFAKIIAVSGPTITEAMVTVLNSLLDSIMEAIPKIAETLNMMIEKMLEILVGAVPKMVDAGMKIIIGVLTGVGDNIGKVVDKATDLAVNFLNALGDNYPKMVQAGIDLILKVINGIADGIRDNGAKVGEAGANLATALIEGIVRGIGAAIGKAVDAAVKVAKDMLNAAKAALGISSPSKEFASVGEQSDRGLAGGTLKFAYLVNSAAESVGEGMIDTMAKTLTGLSSVLGSDLIDFNPTISPVLDLTSVRKEAASLSDILAMNSLDVSSTYKKLQAAGSAYEDNRKGQNFPGEENSGDTFNYVQNNSSPKALDNVTIYRETNNLISKKRGADA